ncbi:tetratricopeptide repeat protein [Egbenema bharatensis]|uniref:tetratricopeptide repeat protein n=1 Tax=Egbenema bharatensis TaxID=3463334 RepID=UPI003A8A9E3F
MSQINYDGTNYQVNPGENNTNIFYPEPDVPTVGIPQNLPRTHVKAFVGRSQELTQLHEQLQQSNCLAIASIAGMGGIGKTELALQYALHHLQQATYPGGFCWLRARESEVGTQIVNFARSRLGLKLPEDLDLDNQIGFCWQHWREGEVLLILDDVTDYSLVKPYLPSDSRFKILLTTRLQLGQSFQQMEIKVLDEAAALELLKSLTDADRIEGQLEATKYLCQWLGYLPLALELVGRYLAQKPDLTLAEMQRRLEAKRLDANALRQIEDSMTAQLGVAAAFELSWQELDAVAQEACYLLSLFALAPIQWQWVEQCFPERDPEDLEDLRDRQLIRLSLLQRSDEQTYLLHQLIREFFRAKSITEPNTKQINLLKQSVCHTVSKIARSIPLTSTRKGIEILDSIMHHLENVAHNLTDFIDNNNLIELFEAITRFYEGQLAYPKARLWLIKCLKVVASRFGHRTSYVATTLNSLAFVYRSQGKYRKAEILYLRALSIWQEKLDISSPYIAIGFNNLAVIYRDQGYYDKAEFFYLKALSSWEKQLEPDDPQIAICLRNIATLYCDQKRYIEVEPLYQRAITIWREHLGQDGQATIDILNDVANLYSNQGRYEEAEQLLDYCCYLIVEVLGVENINGTRIFDSLGQLYERQERYEEAEDSYQKALHVKKMLLVGDHPELSKSLNNLAVLYMKQERYEEAEPLLKESISIHERIFLNGNPDITVPLINLASIYCLQNRYCEAEMLLMQALKVCEHQLNTDHPKIILTRSKLQALRKTIEEHGE